MVLELNLNKMDIHNIILTQKEEDEVQLSLLELREKKLRQKRINFVKNKIESLLEPFGIIDLEKPVDKIDDINNRYKLQFLYQPPLPEGFELTIFKHSITYTQKGREISSFERMFLFYYSHDNFDEFLLKLQNTLNEESNNNNRT